MTDATRAAALALLAVLALGFVAATLESAVAPGQSSPAGRGGGGGGLFPRPPRGGDGNPVSLPYLDVVVPVLLGLAALAVLWHGLRHWRTTTVVLALAAIAAVTLLLFPPPTLPLGPANGSALPPSNGSAIGAGGGGGGDATQSPPSPPTVLLALLTVGAAALGGAFLLARRQPEESDDDTAVEDAAEPNDDKTAAALGSAAGRAADRIESDADPGVDNEVYRAWREMTALLDVDDPGTTTPGEFADAAAAAGLGREDAAELTRLFEAVRYGHAPASAEREERALAVLRRIEDRYGGDQ